MGKNVKIFYLKIALAVMPIQAIFIIRSLRLSVVTVA